jgi:hypothetical protein
MKKRIPAQLPYRFPEPRRKQAQGILASGGVKQHQRCNHAPKCLMPDFSDANLSILRPSVLFR